MSSEPLVSGRSPASKQQQSWDTVIDTPWQWYHSTSTLRKCSFICYNNIENKVCKIAMLWTHA